MTLIEQVATIAIASLATMLTRFLPFAIFSGKRPIPKMVQALGGFLPPAILGMLVVYCYRSVIFAMNTNTLISVVAGLITAGMHFWRRNVLLSIACGTISYMVLIALF